MRLLLCPRLLVFAIALLTAVLARAGDYAPEEKGKGDEPTKIYVHHIPVPKLCHRLCGPPPPDAPVMESAAVRRLPVPTRTNFRVEQESGGEQPESAGETKCGTDKAVELLKLMGQTSRLNEMEQRLTQLDVRLQAMMKLMEEQQDVIKKLADNKDDPK